MNLLKMKFSQFSAMSISIPFPISIQILLL